MYQVEHQNYFSRSRQHEAQLHFTEDDAGYKELLHTSRSTRQEIGYGLTLVNDSQMDDPKYGRSLSVTLSAVHWKVARGEPR